MLELTPRQREILAWIRSHIEATGAPPTRAEIARKFNFRSANAAEQHLRALARKGAIELQAGTSRGIRLTAQGSHSFGGVPLVGRVAAGEPILAEQHIEEHYQLDQALFRPRPDYLLKVHGMSMRDAGIWDGDLVAVHIRPQAHNGQIVVARIDDEVTVKRFRREGDRVWLLPENPDFSPIQVDLTQQPLVLEGCVVGIIRQVAP